MSSMRLSMLRALLLCIPLLLLSCGDQALDADRTAVPAASVDPSDKDGMHEIRDPDGVLIMRGEKVSGQRHGLWVSYFPDGTLRSKATYVHGLRQGSSTVFHENGAPFYTGLYKNDKFSGDWLFYDPDGTPVKRVRYDDEGNVVEERDMSPK